MKYLYLFAFLMAISAIALGMMNPENLEQNLMNDGVRMKRQTNHGGKWFGPPRGKRQTNHGGKWFGPPRG